MPLISSSRETFGPQARRTSVAAQGNSAAEILTSAAAAYGPSLPNGSYSINVSGTAYSTALLLSSSAPDGGGWTLAYNLMFDETWMRDQRGYANGTIRSADAYAMSGFWTNSAPGGAISNTYDLRYSCRAAGAYISNYTKIMIMYHDGTAATTNTGQAWGYYTKASGVASKSLRSWFNDNDRDTVWSSGGRTNQLRTSWTTPWGNSLRSFPGGGDLFVDNSDNPGGVSDIGNMGAYNLVLNGSNAAYGYGASTAGDHRLVTTIAGPYNNSNTPYPHTFGGIGWYHNNAGYPCTGMAAGIYDYCDGRRNAFYGDGGEAIDVTYAGQTGQAVNVTACANANPSTFNTAVKGVSIWVK